MNHNGEQLKIWDYFWSLPCNIFDLRLTDNKKKNVKNKTTDKGRALGTDLKDWASEENLASLHRETKNNDS